MKISLLGYLLLYFCLHCSGQRIRRFEVALPSTSVSLDVSGRCNDSTSTEFQTLIIYRNIIYVGATNAILQFSPSDLSLRNSYMSGPDFDANNCAKPFCENNAATCEGGRQCTNNYNKLLVPHRDRLIACGTLYASCNYLRLSNLTMVYAQNSLIQCGDATKNNAVILSSRSRTKALVGVIYINEKVTDSDFYYIALSELSILLTPRDTIPYFTQIGGISNYINSNNQEPFLSFHLTWTSDQFTYFIGTLLGDRIMVIRFCNNATEVPNRSENPHDDIFLDHSYGQTSYTQIELICSNSGAIVNAKFISGKVYILFQNRLNTTLCSSSLININEQIDFARDKCLNSSDPSFATFLGDARSSCGGKTSKLFEKRWATCGVPTSLKTFVSAIDAKHPIMMSHEATIVLPEPEVAKSFTVAKANGLFSAFIGTTRGDIVKVSFGNGRTTTPERIASSISGSAILDNMVFDESGENIFAITSNSIRKAAVADCEGQYQTCTDCLESRDPYCGWCVLQSRCTRKSSCDSSTQPNRWLGPTMQTNRCPFISNFQPSAVTVGTVTKINLTFSGAQLQSDLAYTCQFSINSKTFPESNLETLATNPQCTFSTQTNYVVPPATDHENVTVDIMHNGSRVASGVFMVYACANIKALNTQTMCTSCVSSRWGCSWCKDTATCSSDSCPNAHATNQSQCPSITGLLGTSSAIPVGLEHTFILSTNSLLLPLEYTCQYNFCGVERTVPSAATSASVAEVRCTASAQLLACDKDESKLRVSIRSGNYIVDTLPGANVTVDLFNCSATATDCGRCAGFRRRFSECAWCYDIATPACQPSSTCSLSYTDIGECSPPSIDSISSQNGPTNGSTLVTIRGQNLGSSVDEIVEVLVAGVRCTVQPNMYISSTRIVCLTQPADAGRSGAVEVRTSYSSDVTRSSDLFLYEEVQAMSFSPDVVLYSSNITIRGRNLNVGRQASIYLNDSLSSAICFIGRKSSRILCPMPFYEGVGETSITVRIDGYARKFENRLRFVSPPTYTSSQEIRAFRSAGGVATLALSSLNGVQTAALKIGETPSTDCAINRNFSGRPMNSVTCNVIKRPSTSRRRRQVGDSFMGTLILNGLHNISIGSITYVDDPTLDGITSLSCDSSGSSSNDQADDGINDESSELTSTIQIPGQNFALSGADRSEYTVYLKPVGTSVSILCNVSYITATELFCRAFASELNAYTNQQLTIEVTIGELDPLSVEVSYCSGPSLLVIVITIPILVLLLLIIIILLWRHKKRVKKQAEERKRVLKHLDDLENKTRETARNAYYELQLGYMNNLADNLTHRITYMPPELYFTQTLFNLARGHPVLDQTVLQNQPTFIIEAIEEWMVLLKNKDFLLTFITTLEEQKRFTVQEKGNVASLLTVCLLSDMPYYTSVMFDLLTELIQKHVQKNPKLLLRRSESVVEKMVSFWLSITLYDDCILERSGKPIFLLAKAIHYLVSSAPCDVIAHKALNSLNESTLLGKELSYTNMTLHASIEEKDTGIASSSVEVSVVNVDSITQTKVKIIEAVYKDKPYSELPKPDDLDLELHGGSDSKKGIVLSDIDSVSAVVNSHTQINTLKHYNVPNEAHVVLKPVGVLKTEPESGSFERFYDRKDSFSQEIAEDSLCSQDATTPLLREKTKKIYHLIHPSEEDGTNGLTDVEEGHGGKKTDDLLKELIERPLQEIYLTRMVKSKTTLQQYVDDVFQSILCPQPIPSAVRYFFQFLDREAARHKITDPEVIHIWKTNSLLLRYWVNVLKNPEFVFDINKTIVVDSCLNVITQAFMDACTTTTRKLGHDSPSNKLLYAKDAAQYKSMVTDFFAKVKETTWLKEEDIDDTLKRISQQYAGKFNPHVASQQLYQYLFKYKDQMLEAVREENIGLAIDVEALMNKMEGKSNSETTIV